jgi:PmbA protein
VPTCEVPVVFDPETAAELLGTLFRGLSGYSVFRNATFLKDKLGQQVGSPSSA